MKHNDQFRYPKFLRWLCFLILFSHFSISAQTITDTVYVTMDSYIDASWSNQYTNYGSSSKMIVGDGNSKKALVYFDLSSIPGNANITSAEVILRSVSGGSNNQGNYIAAYMLLQDWEEYEVTWNRRTSTNLWSTAGGQYGTALSSRWVNPYNGALSNLHSWSITDAVTEWINDPSSNFGIIFDQTGNNSSHEQHFGTREDPNINNHPRLVITYTTTIDSLWLRGNYGTNTTTEGATISQWDNVWGNNNFYQDNTTFRPIYRRTSNLLNFNPVVEFDGVNDFLVGNRNFGVYNTNRFTTFTVMKSSGSDKYIWAQYNYRANTASHSILTNQRVGAFNQFRAGTNTIPTTPVLLGIRRNNNNNFSLYYNGTNEVTNTIPSFSGSFLGNNIILGSRGGPPSNTLNGAIAEMMIFNRTLTDPEVRRINSYLAAKYGISLDSNYIASNGTVFWNQATNNQYNKGIFGIGRDDTSTLNQEISQSTSNPYSFLTISTDSNFQLPNPQHTNMTNNLSFLMVGSNANSDYSFQTNEISSASYNTRIDYEWLVQSTNFTQTVNLKFQGLGSTELRIAYLVKKNGNSNFSSNVIEVGPLDSNGVITGVTLNNNDYFTLFFKKLTPGGVNDNLRFWAKADYGVAVSGSAVTQWRDVANTFYLTQSTSARRPSYQTNAQNFNPTISFSASGTQFFERNASYNIFTGSYSIYIVGFSKTGQSTFISANHNDGSNKSGVVIETNNTNLRFLHRNPPATSGGDLLNQSVPMSRISANLFSFFRNTNTKHKYWINGGTSFQLTPTNTGFSNNVITDLTVGRLEETPNNNYLDGEIAEIIIFNNENEYNRIRIESYLAVKYGISINDGIGEKYVASDSTIIFWNNTSNNGYNHDIFGIGRDDVSTLNQKQSRPANSDLFFSVYLLPLETDILPTTNQLNTTQFETDRSFLMFGNNNDSINRWVPGIAMPSKFKYRLKRIWKFQKTGTVNNAVISISTADLPFNTGSLPVYLLVSDTPDMTNATYYRMTLVGNTWRLQHSFNAGSYITFGYGFVDRPLRHGKTVIEGVRFPYNK